MNALDVVAQRIIRPRKQASMAWQEWASLFSLDNFGVLLNTTLQGDREIVESTFAGYVNGLYLRNSVVFACLALRARLFAEARFQFQQLRAGRPGALFGTPALNVLEHPEPGNTTGDLLSAAILDADLAGNAFLWRERVDRIKRIRPDWMTIVYGSRTRSELGTWAPDAERIGYSYKPGGLGSGEDAIVFDASQVSHFVSNRHPLAHNVGISLLTAGLREIMGDNAATGHKLQFFEHAATPNLAIKLPPTMSKEKAEEWIELYEQEHKGALNAYKTLFFGGGVESSTIGNTFEQMTFKELQGKAETRIAALTGMHPVIAALSEGLQGASLGQGNFGNAARQVADGTLRPLWRNMAGSLETIVPPVPGSRLWYDARDVAFLRADTKEEAETNQIRMSTINSAITQGWTPESAKDAVISGDLDRLVHTGLVSVQLQEAGQTLPGAYRVTHDFWAAEGTLARLNTIRAGTLLSPDHPIVAEFPSLVEPSADQLSVVVPVVPQLAAGSDDGIRCSSCGRLWGEEVRGYYRFTCSRCKTVNEGTAGGSTEAIQPSALTQMAEVQRQQAELLVALAGRSTTLSIEPGAISVPVNVTPPSFSMGPGAISVSTPVTVEPSPVTIAEGAVQVHSAAPQVSIEPGAVQVEVHAPPMSIEPGAVQVTVEPSPVTIESGAVQVGAPDIHVDAPAITVEAPDAPKVEIADGAFRVNVEPIRNDDTVVDAIRSLEEKLTRPRVIDKKIIREFLPSDDPDKPTGRPIGVQETEIIQ